MKALAAHRYVQDSRFIPLLNLLLSLQNEQGQWMWGSVFRTWTIEERNQSNKWIMLDTVRVLKEAGWNRKQQMENQGVQPSAFNAGMCDAFDQSSF